MLEFRPYTTKLSIPTDELQQTITKAIQKLGYFYKIFITNQFIVGSIQLKNRNAGMSDKTIKFFI